MVFVLLGSGKFGCQYVAPRRRMGEERLRSVVIMSLSQDSPNFFESFVLIDIETSYHESHSLPFEFGFMFERRSVGLIVLDLQHGLVLMWCRMK